MQTNDKDKANKPWTRKTRAGFEVRFAPVVFPPQEVVSFAALGPRQIKNRSGCLPCKKRKVKCDEVLPICRSCQRRKEVCERPRGWETMRMEVSRLPASIAADKGVQLPHADWQLLDYWFHQSCRILCNHAEASNPFSFSLLEMLAGSPAALYAFQSLSAAYRGFFETPLMCPALEQRGKALASLRQELLGPDKPTETMLLTIVILGLSSNWFTENTTSIGLEHLHAANSIIEEMLTAYQTSERGQTFYLAAGMYMYWDMACSFLMPLEAMPVRSPLLFEVAKRMDQFRPPHPVLGISNQLFLLVGSIGRYTRRVWDTDTRDILRESDLEARLHAWEPPQSTPELEHAITMATCFKMAALIMLYGTNKTPERRLLIDQYVRATVDNLGGISDASPYYGYQALILTIISSEVTAASDRALIIREFFQLYNHNRFRVNYLALEVVQSMWSLRDRGEQTSWLQVMKEKGCMLMLG